MTDDNKTGCCFITVDAYPEAVPFYLKNEFVFLGSEEESRYKRYLQDPAQQNPIAMYYHLKNITDL